MNVGSKVFVEAKYNIEPAIIEGETKAYWRVKGSLYSKTTLALRGSSWYDNRIAIPTPELEQRYAEHKLAKATAYVKKSIQDRLNSCADYDLLLKINALLENQT